MAELALFPLRLVLFPGMSLDLQIFEQRYLRLVSRCLKGEQPFGIVGIQSGSEVGEIPEVFGVGTGVEVTDWNQLNNGLLGIRVQAGQRFRIRSSWQQEGLLCAEVDWFDAEPEIPLSQDYQGLVDLLEDLGQHPGAAAFGITTEPKNATELGFALTQLLPLDDADKAALLAITHPLERLELLIDQVAELAQR